ncbi:hypothetical protein GCK32_017338 [Trichostrongylus colubriformis]|uniref:Uncharacterized protein n=1 Tax=Trichostrongylus colubriformis TaxID=6319 RepID=A0AAN8FQV1_TRICO
MLAVFYLSSFVPNTVVVFVDVLIIYYAYTTSEIRRHFVLQLVFLPMLMDMAAYLVVVIHDLPSLHLDVNLFSGTSVNNFFVLIIPMQYFTQLFVLLAISVIHAVAVFYPAKFRAFSSKDVRMINVIIVVVAVIGTGLGREKRRSPLQKLHWD